VPRRRQPQAVHRASYESSGSYSTTSIVNRLQTGQEVGRNSIRALRTHRLKANQAAKKKDGPFFLGGPQPEVGF
jgi:hypothetical protein